MIPIPATLGIAFMRVFGKFLICHKREEICGVGQLLTESFWNFAKVPQVIYTQQRFVIFADVELFAKMPLDGLQWSMNKRIGDIRHAAYHLHIKRWVLYDVKPVGALVTYMLFTHRLEKSALSVKHIKIICFTTDGTRIKDRLLVE